MGKGVVVVDAGFAAREGVCVAFVDELVDTDTGCRYGCPSSPGANERVEQNPSDELMINVKPSEDLDKTLAMQQHIDFG